MKKTGPVLRSVVTLAFSQRLERAMVERDLSVRDLAKLIGSNAGTVGDWRGGANLPSAERVVDLANALDVTTDWLLGRETDK